MQTHSQRTERLGLFACLTNWDANFPSQDHEDSKTGQSYLQLPGKLKLSRERVAQRLKHLPEMRETWVRFLGWEDPLEEEMAPHSSTLAWRVPWTEEPGGLWSMGSQRVGHG